MTGPKKILILGGYGKAGRQIAFLLAKYTNYAIFVAGRNLSKAEKFTSGLLAQFPERQINAVEADADESEELINIVKNVNLVIVCIPLSRESTLHIIKAILKSNNSHYIDLSPGTGKYEAFAEAAEEIKEGRNLFILDAGFDPGLPGFLSHWAASLTESPEELEIEAVYKDPDIGESGIKDILRHGQSSMVYKKSHWENMSVFHVKTVDFPKPFGRALAIPAILPELQGIPETYGLKKLEMYQAGINSLSNVVLMLWKSGLKKLLSVQSGIKIFQWAAGFTKPPYGGAIKVTAKGSENQIEITVCHEDLHDATAVPVVATAIQILEKPGNVSGQFFMGEWVSKDSFVGKLEEMGLVLKVRK